MPEIHYKDFQQIATARKFSPIYLFYGEEDFLIDECVDAIIETTLDPGTRGFNLDVVYGSRASAKDVIGHASSFPMMSDKRVVVVKEFEKLVAGETAKEIVTAYIHRPLASTHLLLVSEDPDFRRKPFTDLKKKADIVHCARMYDNQVPTWIAQRVRQLGKEADVDACRLLQAYVGTSLRAIQNELDKLFIFVGDRKTLKAEDVAEVVGASKGYTVFDLQNAIGRRDMKEAARIVQRMLEGGESPQLIIIMLTRFFTQLWKLAELKQRRASDGEIASELRVSPYFVRNYLEFSSNFSTAHIESTFSALIAADAELKSTSRDPHLVLDLLLYTLIRGTSEKVLLSS